MFCNKKPYKSVRDPDFSLGWDKLATKNVELRYCCQMFVQQTFETPSILAQNRKLVDDWITNTLRRPNWGIMITARDIASRFVGPEYLKVHHQLSDFEIRDLFNGQNNLMCLKFDNYVEWVTIDGPSGTGAFDIQHYTSNVLESMAKARNLLIQSADDDVCWLINYDPRSNSYSTQACTLCSILKRAMVISKWPVYTFGQ